MRTLNCCIRLITTLAALLFFTSFNSLSQPQWQMTTADKLRITIKYQVLRENPKVGIGSNHSGKFEETLFAFSTGGFARITYYYEITPRMRDSDLNTSVFWYFNNVQLFQEGKFVHGSRGDAEIKFGRIPYQRVDARESLGTDPLLECIIFARKFADAGRALSGFFCEQKPLADRQISWFFKSISFR